MSTNRSVMKHQFSQVPRAEIPRSSFDRSHGLKTTLDAGLLIPIFVDEVIPGDTFNLRSHLFGRMATPLKPFFDNVFMDTFFFFVPTRLLWENWEKMNGSQDNPGDSTDFVVPSRQLGTISIGTLSDYLGLPVGPFGSSSITANDLPYRAYNLIWNEWFRDQNLQDSAAVNTSDTALSISAYPLRRRGKRHDYFTSCLPWPQKGDPVTVPIAGKEYLQTDSTTGGLVGISSASGLARLNSGGADLAVGTTLPDDQAVAYIDLANATGFTINQLRQSFQIQRLLERDARGGTRYTEVIKAHFGVTSPDARLQRPEYLGGGSSMVNINPVQQTTPKPDTNILPDSPGTPQGNLAAFGTVSANNHGFVKSFTEHGYIIGLVSFRADLTYQQGLNRMWTRRTRFDFYWPALSHIGEQEVRNYEIYLAADDTVDNAVFGYQERYAEYRYKPSQITGLFRSASPTSLDVWHLSQDFADTPVLGPTFIEENPPIDRVIAVPDEPHFLLDCYFKLRCARPMPLYGVPGLIDHF